MKRRRRNENENHLCCNGARDGKFDVDVHLGGLVLEVDGGEVLVVRLGQVEGELVVDGQVVCEGRSKIIIQASPTLIGDLQKQDSLTGSP